VDNPQYAAGLLLRLRFELDLWINLRPSRLLAPGLTPLRDATAIDLVVVRENTEGAYVGIGGQFKRGTADEIAIQEDINTRKGVERIQRYAFELAGRRPRSGAISEPQSADAARTLRAGTWFGAEARRQGHRQPRGRHPGRGDDAEALR